MTPDIGTVRAEGVEIRTYRAAFVYQVPFRKDSSTGSPVINAVVLGDTPTSLYANAPGRHRQRGRTQEGPEGA